MKVIYILSFSLFLSILTFSMEEALDIDKMYILIGEKIFMLNLIENEITYELISILPLKIKLVEENFESIHMRLSSEIKTNIFIENKNSIINTKKGDIFLFKGSEIIIFYESTKIIDGNGDYLKIGFLKETEEFLNLVKINKSIFLWNTLNYENDKGKVKPYGHYTSIMNYLTWKVFTFFLFLLL